jgi:hypothetical protein
MDVEFTIKNQESKYSIGEQHLNILTHPQAPYGLNCKSKGEDNRRRRSGDTLFDLQHFGGKRARWSSGMGLGRMISKSIIHMDLHKPNNKLVNA